MNNYPIHINTQITKQELQKGLFIFLFRATRIPPHIGVIYNGKLYEITLLGPHVGLSSNDFFDTITKKYTKTLFIELALPSVTFDLDPLLTSKIEKYKCVTNTISCLAPVKEFVGEVFQIDLFNVNFIFDLLPILAKKSLVKNITHLNLDRNIHNNTFYLNKYTQADIDNCMEALNRKEVIC